MKITFTIITIIIIYQIYIAPYIICKENVLTHLTNIAHINTSGRGSESETGHENEKYKEHANNADSLPLKQERHSYYKPHKYQLL